MGESRIEGHSQQRPIETPKEHKGFSRNLMVTSELGSLAGKGGFEAVESCMRPLLEDWKNYKLTEDRVTHLGSPGAKKTPELMRGAVTGADKKARTIFNQANKGSMFTQSMRDGKVVQRPATHRPKHNN